MKDNLAADVCKNRLFKLNYNMHNQWINLTNYKQTSCHVWFLYVKYQKEQPEKKQVRGLIISFSRLFLLLVCDCQQ